MTSHPRVAVLVTTFNRRDVTLRGLHALLDHSGDLDLRVFLVDDCSPDGTRQAVATEFPERVHVIGGGDLYWSRGMATAERESRTWPADYRLWLNDDVVLDPNAVSQLVEVSRCNSDAIVAGAVCDPKTGEVTYGGLVQAGRHPLRLLLVEPTGSPKKVDAFTGNVVLIPVGAAARVGEIDDRYLHGGGDIEYGLRAARRGVPIVVSPRFVGSCRPNRIREAAYDRNLALRRRWAVVRDRRGLPLSTQVRLYRQYGGIAWPFWLATVYGRILFPRRPR
jgi:GT2 family glycosyltransferase